MSTRDERIESADNPTNFPEPIAGESSHECDEASFRLHASKFDKLSDIELKSSASASARHPIA